MKFKVEAMCRKALREAIEADVKAECAALDLPEDEQEAIVKKRAKKALAACSFWFKDGSSVTLEIDLDAATCAVVPC
jgi:hypothetical protein